MRDALTVLFEHDTADCISETNAALIEVFDYYHNDSNLQRCHLKTEIYEPVHFILENPRLANLTFAALDNCIFRADDNSRCDFFIGNFEKLYFVEIKQVNLRHRQSARDEAIEQLRSTITFFNQKLNLANTKIIAVMSIKAKKAFPIQSAKKAADVFAFKEQYNADLMEGQHHTF